MSHRNLENLLKSDWSYLEQALLQLEHSYSICSQIEIEKDALSDDKLIQLEAYTARFSRLLDIYTQKILRTLDKLNSASVKF